MSGWLIVRLIFGFVGFMFGMHLAHSHVVAPMSIGWLFGAGFAVWAVLKEESE